MPREYPYDDTRVTVVMEHGIRFIFSVDGWGGDEEHKTNDEEAHQMARDLVMGKVHGDVFLTGTLSGPGFSMSGAGVYVHPARIIAIVAEPVEP